MDGSTSILGVVLEQFDFHASMHPGPDCVPVESLGFRV